MPMEIIVWMLTGGAVGWASHAFLRWNESRGMNVAIAIGAVGALIGGKMIGPMLTAAAAPGALSAIGLLFAAAVATAFLALGNLLHERWGV